MKRNFTTALLYLLCFIPGSLFAQIPSNPYKAPLYWSVYEYHITREQNGVSDNYIPEDSLMANVNWVDANLKNFGYKMICMDGWGDISVRNENGYRASHSRHWQHNFAWWSNELQSRGMALGMYGNPLWVSVPYNDTTTKIVGTNIPVSSLIDTSEHAYFTWAQVERPGAEQYVKGYIKYYADMGIKYFRVDFLSWYENGQDRYIGRVGPNRPHEDYVTALKWMREAADENGVFLSLVMPNLFNEAEVELQYGHMFRINEDTGEGAWYKWNDKDRGQKRVGWSVYANPMDGLTYWSYVAGKNKMILDPDFLRLNTFANDDEKKTVISACLIAGAPVTVSDEYFNGGDNLRFYQNTELLALNADGFVGKPLTNDPTDVNSQTWKGQLSNGDWVVALFNRENEAAVRSIDFSTLGFTGNAGNVRDLWAHNDLGPMAAYSATIPPHGCVVIKITTAKPTQATAPVFGLPAAVYTTNQKISLSTTTTGAKIYFTVDGSTPDSTSAQYKKPFKLITTATVKAVAYKKKLLPSAIASATYYINKKSALPAPWKTADIGDVSPAGTSSYKNNKSAFINTASGNDIEGTADAFRFIYQALKGDVVITTKLDSFFQPNEWTKAGLMVRESLAAGAKNAFMGITAKHGFIFQNREETSGGTSGSLTGATTRPVWLKLQRAGDVLSGFYSTDSIHWLQAGAVSIPMSQTVYAGMAYTSHQNGTLGFATFSNTQVAHAGNITAAPVFAPSAGTYTDTQYVAITSATPGAVIYYTVDGSVPDTTSLVYGSTITVASTSTLKAMAVAGSLAASVMVTADYVIDVPNPLIESGSTYKILNRNSGKALEIGGVALDNGATAQQWEYVGSQNQQWKIDYLHNGFYRLTAMHSNKSLEVANSSKDEGATVQQWDSNDLPNQQWVFKATGNGFFKIENRNSGKVLDVYGLSMDNGAAVKQYSYGGGLNQQWGLEKITSFNYSNAMYVGGSFNGWNLGSAQMALRDSVWLISGVTINAGAQELKFANSNNWSASDWGNASGLSGTASLTTGGGANISFTAPQTGSYTISFNEQTLAYSIVAETVAPDTLANGIYVIKARHSGKALDVVGGSTGNGALIHQWEAYDNFPSQEWQVTSLGNGYYSIKNINSNKALDVQGGSTDEGAAIHQWDAYTNFPSQEWKITATDNGFYKIENHNSNKALDVYGASTDNGALVNQFTYTGGLNQQWGFTAITENQAVNDTVKSKNIASLHVYPNPAVNRVTIALKTSGEKIMVANSSGRMVYQGTISGNKHTINVASLAPGLYYVKVVQRNTQTLEGKFLIVH